MTAHSTKSNRAGNVPCSGPGECFVPAPSVSPRRYLFYSHDGVGLGHTCRNLAIARAITESDPNATVLLATGTDDALQLGVPERVEVLKLPSLRKVTNQRYAARRLLVSEPRIHSLRSDLLLGVVRAFEPDVVLVDKHPLGVGGELRAALELLKSQGGYAVLGLRDILDDPETVRAEWAEHRIGEVIEGMYEQVLVYGQENIFDPVSAYGLGIGVAGLTRYCGYVIKDVALRRPVPHRSRVVGKGDAPLVIASVGGGEDGSLLMEAFLEASAGAPWQAVAVTGPMAPSGMGGRLEELAMRAGARLHEFLPNFRLVIAEADVVVCMGGYNTISEAMSLALPVVCVPRTAPRREQLMRAEAFGRLGLLRWVNPGELSPGVLAAAIRGSLGECRNGLRVRCARTLRFDGAARAADVLGGLAGRRSGPADLSGAPMGQAMELV